MRATIISSITLGTLLVGLGSPAVADDKKKKKPDKKDQKPAPPPPAPDPVPPPPPEKTPPWAEGVTPEQKQRAQVLLEEGNGHFLDKKFDEALVSYEAAVASWNHPAIRFNMVRCLIQLNKPVEAYQNLTQALAYGAAPLEEDVYNEALNYDKLLLGQIAELEVSCDQAGTKVTLDGAELMSCPGNERRLLVPGAHVVVGRKDGFLTKTLELVVLPGAKQVAAVKLIALEEAAVTTRRWKTWKPWAVAGGGILLAGLGGLLQLKAVSDLDSYEREIGRLCVDTGCEPEDVPGPVADLESRAELENKFAIGMMAAGGVVVALGATLVIMNRSTTTYPEEAQTGDGLGLAPLPGGGGMVSWGATF